jgi:hypothetical protein
MTRIVAKFHVGDQVTHIKTGHGYRIEVEPSQCFIESTGEPAYAYRSADGLLWIRGQIQMEDGRFKLSPISTAPGQRTD